MLGIDFETVMKLGNMTREFHNREVETYKFLTKLNNPKIPFTKVDLFYKGSVLVRESNFS